MRNKQGPQPENLMVEANQTHTDLPLPPNAIIPSHTSHWHLATQLAMLCHDNALAPPSAQVGGVLTWVTAWGWHQTLAGVGFTYQCGNWPAV